MEKKIETVESKWGNNPKFILLKDNMDNIDYEKISKIFGVSEDEVKWYYMQYLNKLNSNTKEEAEKQAIKRIPEIQIKGRMHIAPVKIEHWNEYVTRSATGVFAGKDSEEVLHIMEEIDADIPLKDIVDEFNSKNYMGAQGNIIRSCVLRFSNNGYPFYKASSYVEWDREEEAKAQFILHDYDDRVVSGQRIRQ